MTREESIRRMECCRNFLMNNYSDMGEPNVMAFNMAIKALEQEPCEDAIRRQAVLEIQTKYAEHIGATKFWQMRDDIKALPSVNPQEVGHWIADVDKWGDIVTTVNGYRCDKCSTFNSDKDNYCPNCGAKMESEE